jgi:acylphosphatase
MKAVHIFISGRVQGVGFRQFIHAEATARGVGGWARNLSDVRALTKGPYTGPLDARFVLRPTA